MKLKSYPNDWILNAKMCCLIHESYLYQATFLRILLGDEEIMAMVLCRWGLNGWRRSYGSVVMFIIRGQNMRTALPL